MHLNRSKSALLYFIPNKSHFFFRQIFLRAGRALKRKADSIIGNGYIALRHLRKLPGILIRRVPEDPELLFCTDAELTLTVIILCHSYLKAQIIILFGELIEKLLSGTAVQIEYSLRKLPFKFLINRSEHDAVTHPMSDMSELQQYFHTGLQQLHQFHFLFIT